MRAWSNRALSRGTRARHMMAPPTRGWLGLSSTIICTHPHASRTLVCATDSPRSIVGAASADVWCRYGSGRGNFIVQRRAVQF